MRLQSYQRFGSLRCTSPTGLSLRHWRFRHKIRNQCQQKLHLLPVVKISGNGFHQQTLQRKLCSSFGATGASKATQSLSTVRKAKDFEVTAGVGTAVRLLARKLLPKQNLPGFYEPRGSQSSATSPAKKKKGWKETPESPL